MEITAKSWNEYKTKMSQISQKAADLMQEWVDKNGFEDRKALIEYGNALVMHYGSASGTLACEMYEKTAAAQGKTVRTAEMADLPSYGEVAKAINGTMKQTNAKVPLTVGRLTKQVGADTTLKNGIRDRAEFAWVPSGAETCAFCLTLASRGWQRISKRTLRKGYHAEHIHAGCDCQYSVRFDGSSSVEGYDPDAYYEMYENAEGATPKDKINTIRRILEEEQSYRMVQRGKAETFTFDRRKTEITVSVKRVDTYETPVYISDNANIKPKALNTIVQTTRQAAREFGISEEKDSAIVILSKDELDNAYGLYDACTNTTYYSELAANSEIQKLVGGKRVIERHETWHAKQADDYRSVSGEITRENKQEYLKNLCKKCKKNLDALGITVENVDKISDYAARRYYEDRFDEVEADYMALKK